MADNHFNLMPPLGSLGNIPSRFLEAKRKLNMVVLWAAIVGSLAGLVGGCFRIVVHHILHQRQQLAAALANYPIINWLIPSLVAGVMVYASFWLIRRLAPDTSGSGIPQIEGAIDNLLPLNWQRVLPVKFFGGMLSIGAGMIAGFEGPTIQMGASIGKMVGSFVRASSEQTRILIASGAGAGLAAAFNAPIAGILFIAEEVRPKFDLRILSDRSVMVASVMASIVVRLLLGQDGFMKITHFEQVPLGALWMFVILGIGLGIIGYYFNFFLFRSLDWFGKLRGLPYQLLGLLVGSAIGLLGLLYAPLVGSGDESVIWTLDSEAPGRVLLLVFLGRFLLTMICYGSGEIGGIFAPLLALATLFSLGLARVCDAWFPGQLPQPGVFAVAGMGGLVAATVRAPLTAVMLTMELTDNFLVALPMLVACIFASITAHFLGGEPVYSVLLKRILEKKQPPSDQI
jgi:CIC family chloride channel protein